MKTYAIKCPNCNADIVFSPNEQQVKCSYCGGIIYREDDPSQQIVAEKQLTDNLKMIKTILDKRAELRKAEMNLAAYKDSIIAIKQQKYLPSATESLNNLSDSCLGCIMMGIPILFGFMALLVIDEVGKKGLFAFVLFLLIAVATIPLFFKGKKQFKETDKKTNDTNARIEAEKRAFEERKSAELKEAEQKIMKLQEQIIDLEKDSSADWLPDSCRTDAALNYIYGEMKQGNCVTISQAIHKYEDYLNA